MNWVIGSARNDRRRHKSCTGTTKNLIDGDLTLPVCIVDTPFRSYPVSAANQWVRTALPTVMYTSGSSSSSGYRQEGGQAKEGELLSHLHKNFLRSADGPSLSIL